MMVVLQGKGEVWVEERLGHGQRSAERKFRMKRGCWWTKSWQ